MNEGQAAYRFLTDAGTIARGSTQIGEVKRPLAAVSKITAAGNLVMFGDGCDFIIDESDPAVAEIKRLVGMVRKKTPMYLHKGTYRMRAWILPENSGLDQRKIDAAPFGGQGRKA